jgi:hypothetical protein
MKTQPGWSRLALVLVLALLAQTASAQNVEYVIRDGVRYQVSTRTVQRTVPVTEMQDRHQTVYTQQITTDNINQQQVYSVPTTQYHLVSRLRGRWNPFITPYWTHEMQPVTTWSQQVANVQIPVSRVAWAPQTSTVQVPVTTYRTAEVEETTRVAMSGTPTRTFASAKPLQPTATIAARPSTPIGGVAALKNDPPKQATGWGKPIGNRY